MAEENHPSRQAIRSAQWSRLESLLHVITAGNAFYRNKMTREGINQLPQSLAEFSGKWPFTTKPELVDDQKTHPPYGTNLSHPLEQFTRFHQTSGTSGAPLRWLDTPENWEWMLGNWDIIYDRAGLRREDHVFFAFSFGPFIGFWLAFEAAARRGCLCLPGGGLSTAARLRLLLDNASTVLCCTPTYALRMAEVAAAEGIDLAGSKVRVIIVAGEPGGSIPATRQRLESLWPGARVFDHHGMTEVGPASYECPAQPGRLHIIESSYFTEIINPDSGRPVGPGEEGELILTTLGRGGSPLLRYRTGDIVRGANVEALQDGLLATRPCVCGSHDIALEGGILGRVDDMVVVRGVNIYPSAIDEIIQKCGGVAEYRVRVTEANALAELMIEVEPPVPGDNPEKLAERLEKEFLKALALRIPVSAVALGTLPRFEMKAKRWIRS